MMFQFYFKRMGSSENLKDLSQRKITDVVGRLLGDTGLVRLTFTKEKSGSRIHCSLKARNGQIIHAIASSDNMYASIDVLAQKIEAQLTRMKTNYHRRARLPNLTVVQAQDDDSYVSDDFEIAQELRYVH
jgi:ribosomal subunit interface protein